MPPIIKVHFVAAIPIIIRSAWLPSLVIRRPIAAALRAALETRFALRGYRNVGWRAGLEQIDIAVRIVRFQIWLLLLVDVSKVTFISQEILCFKRLSSVFLFRLLLFVGVLLLLSHLF